MYVFWASTQEKAKMNGDLYPNLIRASKAEYPDIHIYGFSPNNDDNVWAC